MTPYFDGVARRPWAVLLLVAAVSVWLGSWVTRARVDFSIESLFLSKDAEVREYDDFQRQYGREDSSIYVVLEAKDGFSPQAFGVLDRLTARLGTRPEVSRAFSVTNFLRVTRGKAVPADDAEAAEWRRELLASPILAGNLVGRDGTTAVILLETSTAIQEARVRGEVIAWIRRVVAEETHGAITRVAFAGIPVIEQEYAKLIESDQSKFTPLAVGIFMVLLFVYFRTIGGVILPLATVMLAAGWAVGILTMNGRPLGVLTNLVPTLVLVIGIGDSIHLLSRYAEELHGQPDQRAALSKAFRTMLIPCLQTSATTAVGFLTLVTTTLYGVQEFGLFCAIGVMLAYLVSMTFLPAMLAVLRPLPSDRGFAVSIGHGGRLLEGIARFNDRHRWWVIIAGLGCIVTTGIGISRVEIRMSWFQDLDVTNPVVRDTRFIEEKLTGTFTVEMVVDARKDQAYLDPAHLASLQAFAELARKQGHVVHVMSIADLLMEVKHVASGGKPGYRRLPASRQEAQLLVAGMKLTGKQWTDWLPRWIDDGFRKARVSIRVANVDSVVMGELIETLQAEAARAMPGAAVLVTGRSYMAGRTMRRVVDNCLSSTGLAFGLIFLLMSIQFRSLTVGFLSMIPNCIPVALTGGLMGFAGIWVNFSTITIFSISLGIAVDNTIHYLARYKEEIAKDGDPVKAMTRVLTTAGRAMIFGTIVLVGGFAAIITSNFVFTRNFALLGGITMISALLADLFLTPTLLLVFHTWEKRLDADSVSTQV